MTRRSETDARYDSITIEPDSAGRDGDFIIKFSTMPGMATAVGELRSGDLDALFALLGQHANGIREPLTVHPQTHVLGETISTDA